MKEKCRQKRIFTRAKVISETVITVAKGISNNSLLEYMSEKEKRENRDRKAVCQRWFRKDGYLVESNASDGRLKIVGGAKADIRRCGGQVAAKGAADRCLQSQPVHGLWSDIYVRGRIL